MSRRAERLLAEKRRRQAEKESIDFSKLCFGPQRAFVEDDSLFVAACTGRRAGKTDGVALKLLRTAQRRPRTLLPYITLSRPSAKRIMWPKLREWDRKLGLGASWNGTDLTMTLPNGSIILLGGANDEAEIDRYRGIETPLVVIDEAQSFRSFLEVLIEDILEPTGWGKGGQVVMTGTPNSSGVGYFARATNPDHKRFLRGDPGQNAADGKTGAWSLHHWTALDNPHMEGIQDRWDRKLARLGVTAENPKIQREHYGRWVRDQSGLIYQIPDRALVPELPEGTWEYHLGVDIGHVDRTAFVVTALDRAARTTCTVLSYEIEEAIPATIHAEVDRLEDRFDFKTEVMDPGGGGKLIVEERNRVYGGRFLVAEKRAKNAYIEMFNGACRAGSHLVVQGTNEALLDQAAAHMWDDGRTLAGEKLLMRDKRRENQRTPNDLLDAMLYSWRAATGPAVFEEREGPDEGTPEFWEQERDRLFEKRLKQVKGGDPDQPWWDL